MEPHPAKESTATLTGTGIFEGIIKTKFEALLVLVVNAVTDRLHVI
jgi:hypothetical protein